MKTQFEVVGTDTGDSSASVLMTVENKRYIFNIPDGLQRFTLQHKVKLSKIDHVLATRMHVNTTGGLPGLLLTVSDAGTNALSIFGPRGISQYIKAVRSFVWR
eukprot:TRINITY_DN8424_c0_g1_i1.p2 TRINITY_DN8424_c0_g1~~TRINITY_DN8424_c0_g1_i1.p2  ORF type:complete len:103 (-),score=28.58 TRINITY_DN8424_c0_g1_i1:170-478(-)